MSDIDWGDVPTWIGAATTGLALLSALVLFRRQSDVLNQTVEEFRRSHAGPAAGVCIWKAMGESRTTLVIWNTTSYPITGVIVYGGKDATPIDRLFSTVFPPGEREEASLPADAAAHPVSLDFTDAFGVRWHRTPSTLDAIAEDAP